MTPEGPGRQINVVLFSGGRGAAAITRALVSQPAVRLTVVVNAYDDGLSTGVARRLFPGMLGPSDIRKNASTILSARDRSGSAVADLLEARVRPGLPTDVAKTHLRELASHAPDLVDTAGAMARYLTLGEARFVQAALDAALDDLQPRWSDLPPGWLDGMAVGNLALAGSYVRAGRDFNAAVADWNAGLVTTASILNVTDGAGLTLVGVKADGTYLPDEASVVGTQSDARVTGLFLLPQALDDDEAADLARLPVDRQMRFLSDRQVIPEPNPLMADVIAGADLIVYGPGTQHSSLLPSYLTRDLGSMIAEREGIEKVFVSNLADDNEIKGETLDSLLAKVRKHFSIGSGVELETAALVTRVIAGQRDGSILPWGVRLGSRADPVEVARVELGQWGSEDGGHFGDRVAKGLMTFVSSRASDVGIGRLTTLSVVMPMLDEVHRVGAALSDLLGHDWLGAGFALEVVVVDGGSTDGSPAVVEEFPGVRLVRLPRGTGRGEAVSRGLAECGGEVLVTFPSDGEYAVSGLAAVAALLRERPDAIVFGNRAALCLDTDSRLRGIYGGRTRAYWTSKYGGMALSLACGTLHKRWVADPLTSIKGFDRAVLGRLSMGGRGVDWDLQLVVDARRNGIPVVEIPVDYLPRKYNEGKKIRASDGAAALARVIRGRWSTS